MPRNESYLTLSDADDVDEFVNTYADEQKNKAMCFHKAKL